MIQGVFDRTVRRAVGPVFRAVQAASTGQPTLQPETTALLARMPANDQPNAERTQLIDATISGLKSDGVWAKLDWLVLLAAHNIDAALLNWVANKTFATVNDPVFTADRGFTGDGAQTYLTSNENVTASGKVTSTSASAGVWVRSGSPAASFDLGLDVGTSGSGSFFVRLGGTAAGDRSCRAFSGSQSWSDPSGVVAGHTAWSRSGSTAVIDAYGAGSRITTLSGAANVSASGTLLLLRAGTTYSDHQISAAWTGAALSVGEHAALHARLDTYLRAVGAV